MLPVRPATSISSLPVCGATRDAHRSPNPRCVPIVFQYVLRERRSDGVPCLERVGYCVDVTVGQSALPEYLCFFRGIDDGRDEKIVLEQFLRADMGVISFHALSLASGIRTRWNRKSTPFAGENVYRELKSSNRKAPERWE